MNAPEVFVQKNGLVPLCLAVGDSILRPRPTELPMSGCSTAPQSEEEGKAKTTAWNNRFFMCQKGQQAQLWGFFFFLFSLFLVLFCRWEVMLESLREAKRCDGSPRL